MRWGAVLGAVALLAAPGPAVAAGRPPDPTLAKVFSLVNKARSKPQVCGTRTKGPAKALRYDVHLSAAAQLHAQDMATNGYFSHESLDGRTFIERIDASGYEGEAAGENLASGQQSAREVVRAWLGSASHCRNLMARRFDAVGLGLAMFDDPQYSAPTTYWAQDFGYDD